MSHVKQGVLLACWQDGVTLALLYSVIATRLLKERRPLDLRLSQHVITELLLYMSRMNRHMERIDQRMPPAQSSENIGMIPMMNGKAAKAKKQEDGSLDTFMDSARGR